MAVKTIAALEPERCTGCGVCVNQCPASCIQMEQDEEGFLRPVIEESRCISCSLCAKTCPVMSSGWNPQEEDTQCYAAWSRDAYIRFQSTSGGVFTHLAQAVIRRGGRVAGACYGENHLAEHRVICQESEIPLLRQSKYVQSQMNLLYREAEKILKSGIILLFAGTPCQCAGLLSYLGREYANLYICDFICRGVNSPGVYGAYLQELEQKYGSAIKQVWFKNKTYGWNRFSTKILFENGQEYLADRETDPFMLGFIKGKLSAYMRPCCYHCEFKGIARPTDITLADFWGVGKQNAGWDSDGGTSLVLVHSEKGKSLMEATEDMVEYHGADLQQAIAGNGCALQSPQPSPVREEFFRMLQTTAFSEIIRTQYEKMYNKED